MCEKKKRRAQVRKESVGSLWDRRMCALTEGIRIGRKRRERDCTQDRKRGSEEDGIFGCE